MKLHFLGLAALAVWGCKTSSPSDESGQIGGIGAVECESDLDCEEPLLELKERFETGGRYHHEFSSSECLEIAVTADESAVGPACDCRIHDSDGSWSVGPVGISCFAWGNFGECILPGSVFEGCEVGADPVCDQHCQALEDAQEAEANKSYDVEIRMFECRENKCVSVVRFDDQCIVNQDLLRDTERDCSLSDDDLISAYEADLADDSPETVTYANGGAPGVE